MIMRDAASAADAWFREYLSQLALRRRQHGALVAALVSVIPVALSLGAARWGWLHEPNPWLYSIPIAAAAAASLWSRTPLLQTAARVADRDFELDDLGQAYVESPHHPFRSWMAERWLEVAPPPKVAFKASPAVFAALAMALGCCTIALAPATGGRQERFVRQRIDESFSHWVRSTSLEGAEADAASANPEAVSFNPTSPELQAAIHQDLKNQELSTPSPPASQDSPVHDALDRPTSVSLEGQVGVAPTEASHAPPSLPATTAEVGLTSTLDSLPTAISSRPARLSPLAIPWTTRADVPPIYTSLVDKCLGSLQSKGRVELLEESP